jgi:tetratricopeptide (TPR) repeat protein
MNRMRKRVMDGLSCLAIGVGSVLPGSVAGQNNELVCGSLKNAFGPFDYRVERGEMLKVVEDHHFTPTVEAAIDNSAGGDLDYTLRAFPNHHRALLSTMRYAFRQKTPKPYGMRYSVECWFDRAVRFRHDDTTVRMLYATFLYKSSLPKEAEAQLVQADQLAKDNGFTHYNIGLVYLEAGRYDKALEQAHKAIEFGFPRKELKDRLVAAGKWRDPIPAPQASASAPDAPASSSR